MTSDVLSVSVLVVGGGPAGLTASLLLGRAGVDALLVERLVAPSSLPRARGVHARAMEILRVAGVEPDLREVQLPIRSGLEWRNALTATPDRELALPQSLEDDVSPCEGLAVAQDVFESVLRRHITSAAHLPPRWGAEVESTVAVEDDGVVATLRDLGTGSTSVVRARYLLVADGSRSRIRQQLGIRLHGPADLGRQRSIAFRADLSRFTGSRPRGMYVLTGLPGVLFWTHPDDRWVLDSPDPSDDHRLEPATLVRKALGEPGVTVEVLADRQWSPGAQSADRYRSGPVFLLGDAAHRVTPMGATGMSLAVHDAHNLAWKLAAVLQGRAGRALLNTYSDEREPVGRADAAESLLAWQAAFAPGPSRADAPTMRQIDFGHRYASSAVLSELVDAGGAGGAGGDYRPKATPGCRAPHLWMDTSSGRRSTIDLFDRHFVLLSGPAGTGWARAAAGDLGGPLVVQHTITEPAWPALYGVERAGAVLVRPDGYVAWRHQGAPASGESSASDQVRDAVRTLCSIEVSLATGSPA